MKEDRLQRAQDDIDAALETIKAMEEELSETQMSKEEVKEKFLFLSEKVKELESILKEAGIL